MDGEVKIMIILETIMIHAYGVAKLNCFDPIYLHKQKCAPKSFWPNYLADAWLNFDPINFQVLDSMKTLDLETNEWRMQAACPNLFYSLKSNRNSN